LQPAIVKMNPNFLDRFMNLDRFVTNECPRGAKQPRLRAFVRLLVSVLVVLVLVGAALVMLLVAIVAALMDLDVATVKLTRDAVAG
jgi:hypothetical protein